MKKKLAALLLATLLAASVCALPAGAVTVAESNRENYDLLSYYSQVVYNYDNGLPTSGVNDVLQTADGYIWVASYDGLVRYDGSHFTTFSPENNNAFESFSINALFEDSTGRLWVGSNEKGALVYENHAFTKIAGDPVTVEAFAEAPDGTVYMGAREGVFVIGGDYTAAPYEKARATSVQDMTLDANGRPWTVDMNSKLFLPDEVTAKFDRAALYSSVYCGADGTVYLGGEENEVVVLRPNGDDYTATKIETGLYRIHSFCETASGAVWMCSDSGLGRLANGKFQLAGGAQFYSSLETIIEDHEGSLWVASSRNGLLQLIPGFMRDMFFAANIPANIVNSAVEFDNQSYIATDDQLIILGPDYERVENELTKLLWNVRTRCLTVDSKENLWLATYETHGAVRYTKDGEITEFNKDTGLSSNKTRVVMEAQNSDIVVGTSDGINIIRDDAVVKTYTAADGLLNPVVLCLAEDGEGRLLIGTDGGGIYTIENGAVSAVGVGKLDSNVILRLYYEPQGGRLWISTSSYMYVYNYGDGSLQTLDYVSQAVGQVFDIVADPEGKLWLLGSRGHLCAAPEDLLQNRNVLHLQKKDGLPYQTTANSWNRISSGGNLFLCGTAGLGLLSTEATLPSAPSPKVTVEQVIVDNEQLNPDNALSLQSGAKRVTFKVVAPHFSPKSDITVEYWLENFDDGWQSQRVDGLGEITYTNLRSGNYTFHVRAKNAIGGMTPTQDIALHKAPSLLERPVFWVVAGLVFLALVAAAAVLIIHARTVKLLRRQQEYKRITDQTIATISNAIDAKDEYTEGHSERVAAYSVEIGRRMGMSEEELEKLRYIALLHDIGKIGISDTILNKPGRLTDDEFVVMKSHTTIGGGILKDFSAIDDIGLGAEAHHEKYNGTGYPRGLKGDEISLIARVIGVSDTYDAMATRRSYKEPMTKEYMIEELKKCSGTQFDPAVAAIMIQMVEDDFSLEAQKAGVAVSRKKSRGKNKAG